MISVLGFRTACRGSWTSDRLVKADEFSGDSSNINSTKFGYDTCKVPVTFQKLEMNFQFLLLLISCFFLNYYCYRLSPQQYFVINLPIRNKTIFLFCIPFLSAYFLTFRFFSVGDCHPCEEVKRLSLLFNIICIFKTNLYFTKIVYS